MKGSIITTVGILLALLGGAGLLVDNFAYHDEKTVLDVGPVEASATVEKEVAVPPLVAGGILGLGLLMTTIGVMKDR